MRNTKNKGFFIALLGSIMLLIAVGIIFLILFDKKYQDRAYPNIYIDRVNFGGKTFTEIKDYWLNKNEPFKDVRFEFRFNSTIATISAESLSLGYDATLSATQALDLGRSKLALSNFYLKFLKERVDLSPMFAFSSDVLDNYLDNISAKIDIPVQDALFQFSRGKVTAFKPSKIGRSVNREITKFKFAASLNELVKSKNKIVIIDLPVETILPSFTTDQVNSFGIKEMIGRGYSEFAGSIPGRIHNVVLAADRLNGVLIKPGETFSFNQAVGDISAATGYQSAYIIKEGRTVLGDGGGVCQVSTTLFRAALASGLPIIERHAHAYRVHYYEEVGEPAGLDATVFDPNADLKILNDTPAYILIQTKPDSKNLSLTFELYGTSDGRRSEIFNPQIWDITPPPPALYQDDPTLPKGVTKQVDFEAWGAKASFQYRVTRNGQTLIDTKFNSNFRPWQAVYLKGI